MKRMKKMFFGRDYGSPSAKVPDDCPSALKELQSIATMALKNVAPGEPRSAFGPGTRPKTKIF
jgi:hypothetical protein